MYMYNHYGGPKHHFGHTRFLQPLVLLSCCRAIIPMLVHVVVSSAPCKQPHFILTSFLKLLVSQMLTSYSTEVCSICGTYTLTSAS